MSKASISPYTHLFNFQIWLLSQGASGGGFKCTSCFRNSPCKNAVFMSIDLRFQLLVIMVDSNVFEVSLDAVGDYFSKVFRLSSSKPWATKCAFGFHLFISLFYWGNPTNWDTFSISIFHCFVNIVIFAAFKFF